jgi:hypothetical protein
MKLIEFNTMRTRKPPKTFPTLVPIVLVFHSFVLALTAATAEAGMLLHIERTLPRIGRQGTTVEVTIQGMCLKDAREIVFYRPGIRAVGIEDLPKLAHPIGLAHGGRIEEQVRCRFEIAPDCPLGEHPFRIRTATEITSLGTFQVTPFEIVNEEEKGYNSNDTIAQALSVPLNVTVLGRMGPSNRGDVDVYRVPVTAGQRLSAEVDSVRIADVHYAGSEYDLALRILDETGHELAANDDNPLHLQDPLASAKIPRDGFAFVEVKRSVFVPADHDYCVHIGNDRRPLAAYPAGGQAGSKQDVKFLGDPLGDFQETIVIPQTGGTFEYFGDAPSPLLLRSSTYANLLEDSQAIETRVPQIPVALNGIIAEPGDTDSFRLTVKKGDRWLVRVFASTLGSPIDPTIRIRPVDATGQRSAVELTADDSQLHDREIFGTSFRSGGGLKEILDPSVIWEPKSDGDYILEIADQGGSGGRTSVYRIEIEPVRNSVHTYLASTAFDWMECVRTSGIAIPQGSRWTINATLPQGQGSAFRGELELVAHGLPSRVRLTSPRVPAGLSQWPVQFVADESAVPGTALITLEARPVDPSQALRTSSQQNIPFLNHSGGDAWRTVRLDRYVLAVTDPPPFSITIPAPTVALVRGGELAIPIQVTRRAGFDQPVEFQCDWMPPGVGRPPAATIPAGESEALLRVSAENVAPLGTWPIVVVASTVREDVDGYLGVGRVRVSSEIVNLTVAEPYVELASQPDSVRRGERKKYVWSVNHKSPFEGNARVKLLGLPKGVTAVEPLPVLNRTSKEIAFEIEATDEALLGRVSGLNCEVIVQASGQEIRQRTGNGTLRIDPSVK